MDKAIKLVIEPYNFDMAVWQATSHFSQEQYNEWLESTAIPTLRAIYNRLSDDFDGFEDVDNYVVGDIINMLQSTQIVIK